MTRVCLIDDDIYVRDAMAMGLADAGFEVVTAPGVAAGLDIIRREGVDAIVTDMHMPGTDGAQLIAEAHAEWPNMPIVLITGSMSLDGVEIDEVARQLGADALFMKPFRARELAEKLNQLLAARA
jgi:DNA-binding response OmpR family regulator